MTVYISPVGYDSTRVTRPILSEGIEDGDRIVLLRPAGEDDDTRAAAAIEDIERMVKQVQPDVTVAMETVPPDDFQATVLTCSTLLLDVRDDLVVNFGGGPREVYLAIAIATLAHPDVVDKTLQFSDLDGSVEEIPLPRITGTLPESAIETLGVIIENDDGIGIPDLVDELGRAKSTVSRHIKQLEDAEAVSSEMHGKTKYVNATFTGELRYRVEI